MNQRARVRHCSASSFLFLVNCCFCAELSCPELVIENGRPSTNETERDAIVEILCDEGHIVESGLSRFSCLSNGSWSAKIPSCSSKT